MSQTQSAPRSEVLILRAGANGEAARVVDEILREAGLAARIAEGEAAAAPDACTVALLSQDLLASPQSLDAVARLLRDDPMNAQRRLVVLRIEDCEPAGPLKPIAYVDLVPLLDDADTFKRAVVGAVAPGLDLRAAHVAALHRRSGRQILHATIRPSPDFVGRAAELAAIGAALARKGAAVVHGVAGVGKSALARHYAWDDHERYAGVWWLRGTSRESLMAGLVSLGGRLIPGLDETPDHARAARLTLDTISQMQTGKPWLLVYDDVDGPEVLANLTPAAGAHVLATSARNAWQGVAEPIALDVFARPLAMDYLLTRARKSDAAAAGRLADALGRLPLSLAQARATAWATGLDFDAFRTALTDGAGGTPGAGLPDAVAASFGAAFRHAGAKSAQAERLLAIVAFLAPVDIPLDVVSAEVMPGAERDAALAALCETGLAAHETLDDGSPGLSVHPLVQEAMRRRLGDSAARYAALATRTVAAAYPGGTGEHDPADVRAWSACDRLEGHVRAVLADAPDAGDGAPSTVALLGSFAHHLDARGDLDEAELHLRRAIAVGAAAHGESHAGVADHRGDLARLLRARGAIQEAEQQLRQAVAIIERAANTDASRHAGHLDALAGLLHASGRPEEAEPLWRRAVEVSEASLGADHPDVARRLGTLAQFLHAANRRTEAEPLMRRALDIAERRLGAEHPGTAERLSDLAQLMRDNGQTTQAEPLLRRALAIDEAAFGPEHPVVAGDLGSLAGLLRDLRRPEEALPLARRALAIDHALFEPEHPVIARHYNNIAMILTDMGRPAEVDPYIRHAILAAEKSLGPDHPETRRYRANYERVLAAVEAMARQDDAVEAGKAPPPPERLARQDIPPPTRKGLFRRMLQNKRVS